MAGDGWVTAFIAAGGGTVIGSVVTAFIRTIGSKGIARAEAADKAVSTALRISERLEAENDAMRRAIILVTEVLDDLIAETPMDAPTKAKLRRVNKAAKLAAV